MTLNIQAYFDKGNNLVGADAYRMHWNLIRGDGYLLRSLSDNQDNYAQAPDEATQVLDLCGCELTEMGQLKKIKMVKVVKGHLDEMEEQHPEVMKILRDLTDQLDEVDEKTGIGTVRIPLDKGFVEAIKQATNEAMEQVKEEIKNKPEKLYYVKFPENFDNDLGDRYLNLNVDENNFFISSSSEFGNYKTKFTSAELDDIQKQLPFLNIGMLKVPVEDDE